MSKPQRLVVIDGKSVFYRGYYAVPNLSLPDGTPTGGVYGFAIMALEVIKKMEPDYVIVAWDKPKTNVRARLKLYPDYKAGRKPMPPDMREQIPYLHKLLAAFGWPLLECDDYEADDIMGTLSEQAHEAGIETMLVTSDLDMLQLVNDNTTIAALKKGLTNIKYYDPKLFKEEFAMTPAQFIDYKALRGDPSDNIPGVKGVGEKTAKQLIADFSSLEGVYDHLDEVKGAIKTKLQSDRDMAFLSRKLITIMMDAPVVFNQEMSAINHVDPQAVHSVLQEYQFKSLLAQLPKSWTLEDKSDSAVDLGSTKISQSSAVDAAKKFKSATELVIAKVGEQLIVSSKVGEALAITGKLSDLKEILENNAVAKIGYDIKETIKYLLSQQILIQPVTHDVRIGAFLINSLIREQDLSSLVGGEVDENDPEQVIGAIWQLYKDQLAELNELKPVRSVADNIEWPVIPVLARMEQKGIKLDTRFLAKMSNQLGDQIIDIEQEIYGLADQEFNISSPSQLAEVLYGKLNLPTQWIKKTKTGYSTAASELKKLEGQHPVIDLIYKYREWTKLKSTYVDALPTQVGEDGRLHTNFALDVAPTGRLSSHDPNLQNIPIRSELGREIRKAFVPDQGNVFVSADYSQFELRIAAHLSKEKDMIKAFNEGTDVHKLTAAQIANKSVEEVTKKERYNAKAINFGIMYGQGPHALSQQQGITMKEAKEFIERYFEVRPNLRKLIDDLRYKAMTDGYVETILGRRRPTPDVKSSNFMVREGAYRAAVNTPMQGSAADIMKIAMIKIQEYFDKQSVRADMLVQVHDSILIECPNEIAEDVSKTVQGIMENAYKLDVKLDVDASIGSNWGEI